MITVLYFAGARDAAGTQSRMYDYRGPSTLRELTVRLLTDAPGLASLLPHVRFAANGHFIDDAYTIADGDEIAVIPPVSGG